ncbi:TraR/DksA family transcriptional regulator [bacterium]|nr:TraR/DksA family transcriptional regulator [bacterium]
MQQSANDNENKLDPEIILKIKQDLITRKEQILKDLKVIKEKEAGGRVKFPDFGDKSDENAQEIGEYSTNLATDKVLDSTLRDIDKTLERIEDGSYGICKYCKQQIGKKRLMARPVASACVACKTKLQNQV